jgi:hypothetical protein
MNNNMERFIRDNRGEFDHLSPSSRIWENIEKEIQGEPKRIPAIRLRNFRYAAAAALLLAMSVTAVYLFNSRTAKSPEEPAIADTKAEAPDPVVSAIDPQYAQMVAQFTRMIETKQSEIRAIEKVNPELYRQFSSDIRNLDSTYQVLRKTLSANPNKEQLLEAMIGNLQMQINLLNQQLVIIQKVKQPKKESI